MKKKVYTSLNLSEQVKNKLEQCVRNLEIDEAELLSVLCYKAGKFLCKKAHCLQTVDYQERGGDYEVTPVYFFAVDHEYMHANRLVCKVSVSKLLSYAMVLYLDEIMEKGINPMEIGRLGVTKNSYKKKTCFVRNYMFKIVKNDQFEEFIMKMRMKKTKKT